MKNSRDVVGSILKTAQMGQTGIRSVMPYATKPALKEALRSQKREYDKIEREAYALAAARGWELKELSVMSKIMSNACASSKLMTGNPDSKIAAMMINGNTRGMIKGLKNKHHRDVADDTVLALSQKLLDCENENIKQMQGYV